MFIVRVSTENFITSSCECMDRCNHTLYTSNTNCTHTLHIRRVLLTRVTIYHVSDFLSDSGFSPAGCLKNVYFFTCACCSGRYVQCYSNGSGQPVNGRNTMCRQYSMF